MSKNKNYNSIVFLTTLSVYLGLVLSGGATPSVWAHTALTLDFDLKNEIVFEEDLDKKPDEDLLAKSLVGSSKEDDLFIESIVGLVQELENLSKKKAFEWNKTGKFQIEGLGFCESDDSPAFLGSGSINFQTDEVLEKYAINLSRKLYKHESDLGLGDIYSHSSDYDFIFAGDSFEIKLKISNSSPIFAEREKDVSFFYNQLNAYLEKTASAETETQQKLVAKSTKITFENNQIFIVTRLPRASIDSLIAQKDAR